MHNERAPLPTRRIASILAVASLALTACSGSDSDSADGGIQINDQVVVDPEQVAAARDRADNADEVEVATAPTSPPTPTDAAPSDEAADADDGEPAAASNDGAEAAPPTTEAEIEIAEAEEDELDSLLNALTVFNSCLADDGFEFQGAPGIGGATGDQFESDYLASLGKCATSSNVVESLQSFGAAQDARTPEEIAAFNFGLPVFRECMIGLGWNVGELVPDERGALGFGNVLEPPADSDGFGTEDVSSCRLEAEQHVADNYDADA